MFRAARPAAAAVAVVLALALATPAFADETDPPPDSGGTGSTTDPPALSVGGQPNIDPQVPEGVPGPPDPWPAPPIGDATPRNAPPPTGTLTSPEAIAAREAFRASILAKYGSIAAAAAAGEVDSAALEALSAAPVVDARAQEISRLAHALRLMVPQAWSAWTGQATSLWIM